MTRCRYDVLAARASAHDAHNPAQARTRPTEEAANCRILPDMALATIRRWELRWRRRHRRHRAFCESANTRHIMGQMRSALLPILGLPRPAKIVLGGVLWGALFFLIGLYFTQDITDGIDPKGFVPPSVWGRIPS